jgi:HD-GYP domain-containing protein (c-di-GMP phosphodiesterase class II)
VADLTVGLAKSVDHEISGPYKEVTFSREDLRELEYASLLHDFGKIGVRERVLVKAKKLYEEEFAVVRQRFDYARLSIEADVLRKQLRVFHERLSLDSLDALDKERRERIEALEAYLNAVAQANEPTVLSSGDFEKIETLARETFVDVHGEAQPLLTCNEVSALCVRRGSLTEAEVDEIRSHVAHTYRFLSRIPWGKALRRVPVIAGAHHERLNGTGYPNRWQSVEIPLQSKMMSIADIFDALTASDRPYKKAIPTEKALDILGFEVKDGHVDGDLVKIFRESRVWETLGTPQNP